MGLKQQAVKGFAWTSIGTMGYGGLNLLVTIILARILTPHDFGVIELLIVFSSISEVIVDSGFSQAVIRDNRATNYDLSSVFFFNFFVACLIYTLLYLISPLIASFYEIPEIIVLSRVVFLTIIFNSCSIIQDVIFTRSMNFKPYAIASIIGIVISGAISIVLALYGWRVWALATNMVLFSFIRMLILWYISTWRPILCLQISSIKRYFIFGSNLLLQGFIDRIVTNLESLLIGKFYVKQQLGFFSQGRKLDSYVIQTSNNIVRKVSYPLLAKIQDDQKRLKAGYRTIMGVTMCCISPIISIMICGAEDIMSGIFGTKWIPAAFYLKLWAINGWIITLYSVFNNIFLVKENSRLLLKCSLFRQILRIFSIVLLVKVSIMYMMYGIVAVTFIGGLNYVYWGGRQIDYSLAEIFKDLLGIIIGIGIASSIAVYITLTMISQRGIYSLIILSFFTIFLYAFLMLITNNKYFKEIILLIKRK